MFHRSKPKHFSLSQWHSVAAATASSFFNKKLPTLAAGVAFFTTLAFFPLLAALSAVLVASMSPHQTESFIATLNSALPKEIGSLLSSQLHNFAQKEGSNVVFALSSGAVLLYAATNAVQNLIQSANESFALKETRSLVRLLTTSLALAIGGILVNVVLAGIMLATPEVLNSLGVPHGLAQALIVVRWAMAALIMAMALTVFYYVGPNHKQPNWRLYLWGAIAATLVWLISTAIFYLYIHYLADYTVAYGFFASVIVLMIWFNVSAFIFLLGAEVNHKIGRER